MRKTHKSKKTKIRRYESHTVRAQRGSKYT